MGCYLPPLSHVGEGREELGGHGHSRLDGLYLAETKRIVMSKNRIVIGGSVRILLAFGVLCIAHSARGAIVSRLLQGHNLTISAIGTSETANTQWFTRMGQWLNADYPGNVTLNNEAISGTASPSGIEVQLPAALQHNPDAIFIEFAMNDAASANMTVETSKANLQTMITTIRNWAADHEKSVDVVIQTMNNEPWSGHRPNLPAYYQGSREVAAANGLLLIDHYPNWLTLYDSEADHATWKTYMDSVGVHPNALGVERVILPEIKLALTSQVPEPSGLAMGLSAMAGLLLLAWRSRRRRCGAIEGNI